jgi:membrane protein implicated in regulation of membrane protease activity
MISPWMIWVLAGLVLLGLEIVTPGVFLMWIGLAAIGAGLVAFAADVEFAAQVVIFAVLTAVSIFVGLRFRRPVQTLNTQTAGLAGRTATALVFTGREGRVRLGDSDWAARVPRDVPPPDPGARLRVEGVEGTVLIVRPER